MITSSRGETLIDGRPVNKLAESLPTPFFLFSERAVRKNYERLKGAFSAYPSRVGIDYCVKTNYQPALVRLFGRLGTGALVSCGWELRLALECGFAPERISFHGPCKAPEELAAAIEADVGLIHAYSADELDTIQKIAAEKGRKPSVSMRLTAPTSWWKRGTVGLYARRLGIPWEQAPKVFRESKARADIELTGLSLHLGTQIRNSRTYAGAANALAALIRGLAAEGHVVETVSMGGGWPSPTLGKMSPMALVREFAARHSLRPDRGLNGIVREAAASIESELQALPTPPDLRLEPGRSLIGPAGALITRVVSIRGRWAFVDASRNFLPESSLVGRRRILPADGATDKGSRWYHISGPTLNTMDVPALAVRLPALRVGDVLIMVDAGAYSLSRANRYAGKIPAAYLLDESGELVKIRSEDRYEDIVGPTGG